MGFTLNSGARHSLCPPPNGRDLQRRRTLRLRLRDAQSLPARAFDAGQRPDPVPDRTVGLLPGLLAATRTGLPPAGDDEVTTAAELHTHLQVRRARTQDRGWWRRRRLIPVPWDRSARPAGW